MELASLIISLISGLAGGNIIGSLLKDKNLGPTLNTIVGLIGGAGSNYLLQLLGLFGAAGAATTPELSQNIPEAAQQVATQAQHLDIGQLIGNIAGSGIGGAILTAIVSYIKHAVAKNPQG